MSRLARLARRNRGALAIALVGVLASTGSAAAASYLVLSTSNTASTTTTLKSAVNGSVLALQNTNSTGGTSARGLSITVPSGRAPIVVNSTAGKATNLNADKLDGLDSTSFGQVRQFAQNTAYNETRVLLASFGGLSLYRSTSLYNGVIHCHVDVSSDAVGRVDGFVIGAGGPVVAGFATPATFEPFGLAYSNDTQTIGQIVFLNISTGRVMTVNFAIYDLASNGGCRWEGTIVAGV